MRDSLAGTCVIHGNAYEGFGAITDWRARGVKAAKLCHISDFPLINFSFRTSHCCFQPSQPSSPFEGGGGGGRWLGGGGGGGGRGWGDMGRSGGLGRGRSRNNEWKKETINKEGKIEIQKKKKRGGKTRSTGRMVLNGVGRREDRHR